MRKRNIGFILQGSSAWVGGIEYSKNLVKALGTIAEDQADFELHLLVTKDFEAHTFADMPARFRQQLRVVKRLPRWRRLAERFVPRVCPRSPVLDLARRLRLDFLYPFHRLPGQPDDVPVAAWIPDLQHRYLPEFFTPEERHTRDALYESMAVHGQRVVVSSQTVAGHVRTHYPRAATKIHVLPFCTALEDAWFRSDPAGTARHRALPERFFIVCNQFWQHKNHRAVFEALGLLRDRGVCPNLVCTGPVADYRRPDQAAHVAALLDRYNIFNQVHLLGLIPRSEQVQLMRRALAVIQPSLFEGWSTVVEDARALGKTLALSDIPVHREQDPPHATFFDPHSRAELAALLSEWWQTLRPGPDLERERAARCHNRNHQADYAKRFLDVAGSNLPR
jgi:glycosyltransferase involved in cell wall biosynthesis